MVYGTPRAESIISAVRQGFKGVFAAATRQIRVMYIIKNKNRAEKMSTRLIRFALRSGTLVQNQTTFSVLL